MKRYLFCYQTAVSFTEPIGNHEFLMRCQPVLGEYMTIEEEHLVIPPDYWKHRSKDAFGNRIIYGGNREPHTALAYVCTGIVSMQPYKIQCDSVPLAIWLQPTRLTSLQPSTSFSLEQLDGIFSTNMSLLAKAESIMHYIHTQLSYVPLSTTVETTAQEVMETGQGVCQDFAHLMLAICRLNGITCRYACGFLEGIGETHAWVEVYCEKQNCWIGFDPTHDRQIEYGYVKLAHGRDASDCPVSRGQYNGYTQQHTQINVTLKEI